MPHVQSARIAALAMRVGSGQRQRLRWTVENSGIAARKDSQRDCEYGRAGEINARNSANLRQGSGEHVQGTALIMQIECAVVVVGIGIGSRRVEVRMLMCSDRGRLVHIQRMVIEQRDYARDLRNHEDCQQGCAKAANVPHEGHGLCFSRRILSDTVQCGVAAVPHREVILLRVGLRFAVAGNLDH